MCLQPDGWHALAKIMDRVHRVGWRPLNTLIHKPPGWQVLLALLLSLAPLAPLAPLEAGAWQSNPPQLANQVYFPFVAWLNPLGNVDMVTIPAGSFLMGCGSLDNTCHGNEYPQHTVVLSTYEIDKYEVTNRQYLTCVQAGGCTPPPISASPTRPEYFYHPQYREYPVIAVTWYQANEFCAWAGKRLPTEAEWEKAARGVNGRKTFPWGNQEPDCSLLNFRLGDGVFCVGDTMPVGSYPGGASPYGLLDMAGNVWEWVADYFAFSYYYTYPVNGWPANPAGPAYSDMRAIRSGAWDILRRGNRASRREGGLPYDLDTSTGFRCARTP